MNINIYNIIKNTKVLGPGTRYAIWFQGCHKRCTGCISPDSRTFENKNLISIEDIIQDIMKTPKIEGITISGGEPFEQKEELLELLKELKKIKLNTILYTGYTIEELVEDEENIKILKLIDLVIDGKYIKELDNNEPLRGSSNQTLCYFSEVGELLAKNIEAINEREIEIDVSNGSIFFIGIPNDEQKKSILKIEETIL